MAGKYLFFDYDGTLRSRAQDRVPESAQEAIARLRANGHFVALATGRLQANAMELAQPTGIRSMVADGGNSVTLHGSLEWMEGMPLDACKRFLHFLDGIGKPWAVTTENESVRHTNNPTFTELLPTSYMRNVLDPDLEIADLTCVYKIFVPCAPGEERSFDFGGITWARYSPSNIICEPTRKSVGIKKMMDRLGAPYGDVVVFGDGSNDVSMFRPEWTSVAMGNAIDELKERADYVAPHIDADGILRACEHLGLI